MVHYIILEIIHDVDYLFVSTNYQPDPMVPLEKFTQILLGGYCLRVNLTRGVVWISGIAEGNDDP